ncbi:melatonin receptor type 1B-B-like [Stylophora pistillata]|uniref:melatonin receptor type 1B-B-like n=1 Tax=Stylophora pistillata TaxID=50429 RepID=UPI000C03DA6B|nr:melatonin receptor type 1B-B-like [Stylophora pistillata]
MKRADNYSVNSDILYDTYWWLAPKYFKELSSRPKYLVAVESGIMLLITTIAFGGNFIVCLTMTRNPTLRTATNLLILTLAAADMLTACLPLTVATIVLIKGKWIVEVNPVDVKNFPCQFQGIIAPALTGFSLHIMALTAINRFICVAHQDLYGKIFSRRATKIMISVKGTIILILTSIPYPTGFAIITLDPRRAMCFTTFIQQSTAQMIGTLFLVINVAIPMIVISLSYYRVFKVIRSNMFQVAISSRQDNSHARSRSITSKIKEVKITKTVFAVLLGYVTCWIPVVICDQLSFNMTNPRFPRQGELVFTYFLCLSSAINPFIYGATNRALRKEFFDFFYRRKTEKS